MKRSLRNAILVRDRSTCQSCRRQTNGQVHHILPRGQGGSDAPTNLMTLCGRCHMLISPIPFWVLKKVLRISEHSFLMEKARVEAAIDFWVESHTPYSPAEQPPCVQPVSHSVARRVCPIPEWKRLRPRAGSSWSREDDDSLLADFSAQLPLEEIARRLGRGVFAVEVRLWKLGQFVKK